MNEQKRKEDLGARYLRIWAALFILLSILNLIPYIAMAGERVRRPAVAGYFYPKDKETLRKTVDTFIANVKQTQVDGRILGLMCPHAGYVFSGQVAAYSYREIKGKYYDTVVILGPSHHVYLRGASVGNWDAYATPLGRVPVNKEIVTALLNAGDSFRFAEKAHTMEHSIETQIPFLQCTLRDFDIVPIVMGVPSFTECKKISKALASVVNKRHVLFVASSDMSHYPNYVNANKVDTKSLSLIEKFDPGLLFNSEAELLSLGIPNLVTTLCGLSSVVTVMMTVKELGANAVKVLHHANSGDVAIHGYQEKRRVVGYGAVAFYEK